MVTACGRRVNEPTSEQRVGLRFFGNALYSPSREIHFFDKRKAQKAGKYLTSACWRLQLAQRVDPCIIPKYDIILQDLSLPLILIEGVYIMSQVFDKVQEIIVDLLAIDPSRVTPDARFREDLEADSLDLVELIMEFEDEFGGEISDEDAQKITTVGEAVTYIEEKM